MPGRLRGSHGRAPSRVALPPRGSAGRRSAEIQQRRDPHAPGRALQLRGLQQLSAGGKWLGDLRDEPGLWRDFVPVAFHVAYWDRLGWRDRFASKEFTARQYAFASLWGRDAVYTPGFALDGAEWKSTFGRHLPPPSTEKAGVLSVEYADGGACRVAFTATGDFEVHVAVLGGGITSAVRAGENQGRTLGHDFVALTLADVSLKAGVAELVLPRPAVAGVTRYALAAWITRRGELAPLQATGGWLD